MPFMVVATNKSFGVGCFLFVINGLCYHHFLVKWTAICY